MLLGFVLKKKKLLLVTDFLYASTFILFFKYNFYLHMQSLIDLVLTDFPFNSNQRFELLYVFDNILNNVRILFKFFISAEEPAFSATRYFDGAG